MTKFIKSIMAGLIGLALVTPALAADRTDCIGNFTVAVERLQAIGGTVTPVSPEEQQAIVSKKGPPPVAEPFTFAIAVHEDEATFVIYDKDCILYTIGPVTNDLMTKFLGRVQAGL